MTPEQETTDIVKDNVSWEEIQTQFETPQQYADKISAEIISKFTTPEGLQELEKLGILEKILEKVKQGEISEENIQQLTAVAKPVEKNVEKSVEKTEAEKPKEKELNLEELKKIIEEKIDDKFTQREIWNSINAEIELALEPYDKFLASPVSKKIVHDQMLLKAENAVKNKQRPNWDNIAKEVMEEIFGSAVAEIAGTKLQNLIKKTTATGEVSTGSKGAEQVTGEDAVNSIMTKLGLPPIKFKKWGSGGQK